MKKVIFVFFLIFLYPLSSYAMDLSLSSSHAILYQLEENKILYEKSSEEEISIASLTKIMTALIAIENMDLEQEVVLTSDDFRGLYEADASLAGFYVGEKVNIFDLLYGLMLPSGAEAAQALTRLLGGKEIFISKMNQKAKDLGLFHTSFKNETGLDEEGHYSTVKDIAVLLQYALKNPIFQTIFETKEYRTSNGRITFTSTIQKFLKKNSLNMDYLLGGKTGTTKNAGLCLASLARNEGVTYLLVTARAPNDWVTPTHLLDAKIIYEYFMDHYESKTLYSKGDKILKIPTHLAKEENVSFYLEEDVKKYVLKEFTKDNLTIQYDGISKISFREKVGDFLGTLSIYHEGEKIYEQALFMQNSLTFDFWAFLNLYQMYFIFGCCILFLLLIFVFIMKKKRQLKIQP